MVARENLLRSQKSFKDNAMAFLIPDNLKSQKDVTPSIRKVAKAFQLGLGNEVTVWFEPLYDPTCEKPHLVVLIPDRGIAVLEVFDVEEKKLLGVVRGQPRVTRDGKEIEVENPLARAEKHASALTAAIQNHAPLKDRKLTIVAGAVLPGITENEAVAKRLDKILDMRRCIFRAIIDQSVQDPDEGALLREFIKVFRNEHSQPFTEEDEKHLRAIIQPDVVIKHIAVSPAIHNATAPALFSDGALDQIDIVKVMNRRQESLAKSLGDGHRLIRGVAGSGKTLILVYRAKLLANTNKEKHILVTCYTRTLASQLKYMLQGFSNVTVEHMDKLMAQTLREARVRHPGYDDDGVRLAELALANVQHGPKFHIVMVDEAQDFSTNVLKYTRNLLHGNSDELLIVADAAQNIFKRKFSWKDAGINALGRTTILRVNYRNTREILRFAFEFLKSDAGLTVDETPELDDETAIVPPESAERSGPAPTVVVCANGATQIQEVVKIVKEKVGKFSQPRSIAVMYGASMHDRPIQLRNELRNEGIDTFWLTNPQDQSAKDKLHLHSSPVVLTTIQSAKGLEYPVVILTDIERDGDDDTANRKLAYVGMTRATHELAVVVNSKDKLLPSLQAAKEQMAV